jgi:hypothetical protein
MKINQMKTRKYSMRLAGSEIRKEKEKEGRRKDNEGIAIKSIHKLQTHTI